MKVVLDTNVWLSSIVWNGEAYKLVELLEDKKITIIVSQDILLEIANVLNKEAKFRQFISEKKTAIEEVLKNIVLKHTLVTPKKKLRVIKEDPSDDRIVEAAVEGGAEYIISYDNHLLKLKKFNNINMITPTDFSKKIKTSGFGINKGLDSFSKKDKFRSKLKKD